MDVKSGSTSKVVEKNSIATVSWSPDGRHITYLSGDGGESQLWMVSPDTRRDEVLLSHHANYKPDAVLTANGGTGLESAGVENYAWSHSGKCIAFTSRSLVAPSAGEVRSGVLYDDMNMRNGSDYSEYAAQLFTYCLDTKTERELWRTSPALRSNIQFPSWSPTDNQIAFAYTQHRTLDDPGTGIALVNLAGESAKLVHRGVDANDYPQALAWRGDGAAILFMYYSELDSEYTLGTIDLATTLSREVTRNLVGELDSYLAWDSALPEIFIGLKGVGTHWEMSGIYSVQIGDGAASRISPAESKFADCHDLIHEQMVCVAQSPNSRPKIALLSVRTGAARILPFDANPELEGRPLAPVKELRWTNKYGAETSGYLVTPLSPKPAGGYPLLLMCYGFDGDFVMQASDRLTSYPAQVFARDGIAVLLVNEPRHSKWQGNDLSQGSVAWGLSPLASVETVIGHLQRLGTIDATKVGFEGQSWGGFWVEFTITQNPGLIRAAAILNGGTLASPGSYFLPGNDVSRGFQEHYWGGPPYPPTLENYAKFSPPLLGSRVRSPLLIEADEFEAPGELEMFTALRQAGAPVEMYVYPNDAHNLADPEHRYFSMRRNLEWFEFWLLGRQSSDPVDKQQYRRWKHAESQLGRAH